MAVFRQEAGIEGGSPARNTERGESNSDSVLTVEAKPEVEAAEKPLELQPKKIKPVENYERLQETISGAGSLAELRSAIEQAGTISGSRDYQASEVAEKIKEAEDFVNVNANAINIALYRGEKEQYRQILEDKVKAITRGKDLGIRNKVMSLINQLLQEKYVERKSDLAKELVARARNLDELYSALGWFETVHQLGREVEPQKIIDEIKVANHDLDLLLNDRKWLKKDLAIIASDILTIVKSHQIPLDSGLDAKVVEIFFNTAREKRLNSRAEEISSGFFGRAAKKLGGWFGRK